MGWNRLSQSSQPGENSEQDVTIITWFEILLDGGVPEERWADCYRSAQARENERRAAGKERQIVTPNDLVVEWGKVKNMHRELDKTRLLPEHNLASCQRCFGTGKEEMPDGTVRDGCGHLPFTDGEIEERAQAKARQIEFVREAARKVGSPKPVEEKPQYQKLTCSGCGRKSSTFFGWTVGETCGQLIAEGITCQGQMLVK